MFISTETVVLRGSLLPSFHRVNRCSFAEAADQPRRQMDVDIAAVVRSLMATSIRAKYRYYKANLCRLTSQKPISGRLTPAWISQSAVDCRIRVVLYISRTVSRHTVNPPNTTITDFYNIALYPPTIVEGHIFCCCLLCVRQS